MTEDKLPLAELLAESGDADFLRGVAEAVLQMLMEADVEGLIGAGRHERTGERLNWRNGFRDRSFDTRLGTLQLRIPKLRQGSYFPPFLEPRKTSEKALVAVIQEAWIGGVSTRRVDELVQALGLSGISKSTVSKLCRDIDERVGAFLDRPLAGEWPYLWLDAAYLRQREGGRIVSMAAIIAVACDAEGRREIVGLHIGPSEAETFWASFLKSLVKRGLKGVKLVVSDAHEGLKAAIARVLDATWQRCRVDLLKKPRLRVPGPSSSGPGLGCAARHCLPHPAQTLFQQPPRPLDAQRAGPCRQGPAVHGGRRAAPSLPAARPGGRTPGLAAGGRPAPPPLAEARQAHGRQRGGRARLHGVPGPAQDQAAQHEHPGAPEQGGETPRRRRRHLPFRAIHRAADRRRAARGQRRVATAAPLHGRRGHGRDAHPDADRRNPATPTQGRLIRGRLRPSSNF